MPAQAKIKIGVIDTGVGPHPYLDHVKKVGSILEGKFDPSGGDDVTGHGSHVMSRAKLWMRRK